MTMEANHGKAKYSTFKSNNKSLKVFLDDL